MKKFLALVLAVLMAMSVCVIASSAKENYAPTRYVGEYIANALFEDQDIAVYGFNYGGDEKEYFEFTYDENGSLTKATMFYDDGEQEPEVSMEYVVEMTDATHGIIKVYLNEESGLVFGELIEFTLDAKGRVTEYVRYDGNVVSDEKFVMENTYDNNDNLVRREEIDYYTTVEEGLISRTTTYEYTYNENGNLTEEKETYDDGSYIHTVYTYDGSNRVSTMVITEHDTEDEYITTYTYVYDNDGNYVKSATDSLGEPWVKHEVTVNEDGKDVKDVQYYYDEESSDWEANSSVEYTYDKYGRLINVLEKYYDEDESDFVFDMETYYQYPDRKVEEETPVVDPIKKDEPAKEEETKKTNPETGDVTPVVVLASVMALSLAGVVITKKLAK